MRNHNQGIHEAYQKTFNLKSEAPNGHVEETIQPVINVMQGMDVQDIAYTLTVAKRYRLIGFYVTWYQAITDTVQLVYLQITGANPLVMKYCTMRLIATNGLWFVTLPAPIDLYIGDQISINATGSVGDFQGKIFGYYLE